MNLYRTLEALLTSSSALLGHCFCMVKNSWTFIQYVLETLGQFIYQFHLDLLDFGFVLCMICDHQTLPLADESKGQTSVSQIYAMAMCISISFIQFERRYNTLFLCFDSCLYIQTAFTCVVDLIVVVGMPKLRFL